MTNEKKYLIVGLGNVGQEYAGTRHNYGFEAAHALAGSFKADFSNERLGYIARASFKGRQMVILLPTTYMNLSGKSVKYWLAQENIAVENCLVIYDDIDLPLGVFRMKPKGGGGTHNGIGNIIEELGRTDIPRVRCGIGKDYAQGYQVDYVLGKFSKEEFEIVDKCIERIIGAVKSFITVGMQRTMNQYNTQEKTICKEPSNIQEPTKEK